MARRLGILAAIAIAIVAVVAAFARPSSPSTPVAAPRAARLPNAAPLVTPSGAIFERGLEHVYAVSLAHSIHLDGPQRQDLTVALDGTWAVAYAGSDERGLTFRAELRTGTPAVQRGGVDVGGPLAATLAKPYYFTTTPEGRLISLAFGGDVDDLARGALTTLASMFQVTARQHATTWEAVESDSLGDYRARYARRDRDLHRERLGYERVPGGGAIAAKVVTTGTDVALRDDGWPDALTGHEITRVGTTDLGVVVDAKFSLHHRALARGIEPGWPDGLAVVAVDAAAGAARSAADADRELVGGASLPDLLAELALIDSDDSHARGYQFLRIAALLRLEPTAARAAAELVRDGAPGAEVLVGALGEAGTPEAQAALGDLLATPLPDATRAHTAIALGLTETPTPATLRALATAAGGDGDAATSATLAQGNAALRIRNDDPGAANSQIDALLARLARAADDPERELVLRALGNTGDVRVAPAVIAALASPSLAIRIAATEALRLIPGTEIDRVLVGQFDDATGLVRAAAVFAASARDLASYTPAFARAVRHDRDVEVRRAIVALAGARASELPALRAVVEYAAAHDGDAELRAMARALLES